MKKNIFILICFTFFFTTIQANSTIRPNEIEGKYIYKGVVSQEILYRIEDKYIYKGVVSQEILYRIEDK
ncbi:hypothetical protein LJC57_09430 [Parabacteroides sp. OttesenSCG-928-G07]|nr:hypothetical protein [Parabacteroides sp. OttesenSCG-928-G07]